MNISALDNSINQGSLTKKSSNEEIRTAAKQFEAILLTQLTSALSETSGNDEDSLFGSDGGSGLAKQMFSEHLAKTMAESGGVGLADLIMRKFGIEDAGEKSLKKNSFPGAMAAIREINGEKEVVNFKGNINDFEVISTYEDQIKNDKTAESLENAMLNGKIRDSTRPRIVSENNLSGKMILEPANFAGKVEYEMPLSGRISSSFGTRFHPVDKKVKMHTGVDIAVPRGTPINSAADGVVTFAGRKGGYGNVVIIEHPDGRQTFYAHCDKLLVETGQKVSVGETIAKAGSTGKSTGPHLHFEVRENGKPIDPIKFLSNVLPKVAER